VTEIYDYMRLLFARVGVPYSPATGLPIESQTVSQMVDRILEMADGTRLYLLAPIVRGRKGEYRKELEDLRKRGFQRVKVDGKLYEIDEVPALNKKLKHDIEVVVDRIVVRRDLGNRLADSLETALGLAEGLVFAENADGGERTTFSARFACPVSGFTIDEIEPRLFSFNNPFGACPACDGLGVKMFFDPELVVPDERLSLEAGAIAPWANSSSQYYRQTLASLCKHFDVPLKTPWKDLPQAVRRGILQGTGEVDVTMEYDDGLRRYKTTKPFEGVVPNLERRWKETDSAWVREEMQKFQNMTTCETCNGYASSRGARGQGRWQACRPGLGAFDRRRRGLVPQAQRSAQAQGPRDRRAHPEGDQRAARLSRQCRPRIPDSVARLRHLSGGESQRIRLASQIGSGLTGVLYVLDEPSIGLHQRDNQRLLETLKRLRDIGNTVIVVEQRRRRQSAAPTILVDMGPGAGTHGGKVVASGKRPPRFYALTRQHHCAIPDRLRQIPIPGGAALGRRPAPHHRRGPHAPTTSTTTRSVSPSACSPASPRRVWRAGKSSW
jgi:excinuclease ABC subunit A